MKTYYANECLTRLASYMIACSYPFHFDGTSIEFTATETFFNRLVNNDKRLASISWKIL